MNPPRVGKRQWFITQFDGGIEAARSCVGVSPHREARTPGMVHISNDTSTIVRCASHEREVMFPRRGQLFVQMPPHHLWPWMKDTRSRHKRMTPDLWRWHLVQELNARVRSATEAHEDFPVQDMPTWVTRMLTTDEIVRLSQNEELLR